MYDIIIIGAGPAGISAGIYGVSRGKKTIILEQEAVGGIIGKVSTVTHYSAILPGETGETFGKRLKSQALTAGVEIRYETVINTSLTGEIKTVTTSSRTYEAKKIIIASGTVPRKLGIPGEEKLHGKGIGMNAPKDGKNYTGKNIYVVGGADGAVKEALYLARFAKQLTIIHFEETLGCIPEFSNKVSAASNIRVRTLSRLNAVYGETQVERLDIFSLSNNRIETIEDPGCGIFVYAGSLPDTSPYPGLSLKDGYIITDETMQTNIPGVFAAGDIRAKQVRQAATAVAEGAIAAINAAAQ